VTALTIRAGCSRCGAALPADAAFCPVCGWRNAPSRLPWTHARYWRGLLAGYALFVAVGYVLRWTSNTNLLPTELILGSFLVPACFVFFLYENGSVTQVPLATVLSVFLVGGALGVIFAALLESSLAWLVLVGFVEEACKVAALWWWLRDRRLRGEGHGLVLGAAAGMGFAALETMGYGLNALLSPHGLDLGAMTQTLMQRALLSPLGHGTWTAILAATLWREVTAGRSPFGAPVWRSYLAVSVLHSLYDLTLQSPALSRLAITLPFLQLPVITFGIGLIGLGILRSLLLRLRRTPALRVAGAG